MKIHLMEAELFQADGGPDKDARRCY